MESMIRNLDIIKFHINSNVHKSKKLNFMNNIFKFQLQLRSMFESVPHNKIDTYPEQFSHLFKSSLLIFFQEIIIQHLQFSHQLLVFILLFFIIQLIITKYEYNSVCLRVSYYALFCNFQAYSATTGLIFTAYYWKLRFKNSSLWECC